MSKLSTKLLMALLLITMAIEPAMVKAFTVTTLDPSNLSQTQSTGNTTNYQAVDNNANNASVGNATNTSGNQAVDSNEGIPNNTGSTTNYQTNENTGVANGNTTNYQATDNNPGIPNGSINNGTTNYQATDTNPGIPNGDLDNYNNNSGVSACGSHSYPRDIDGHWAEIYIRRLYDLCIIEGYSDGRFRPNQNITRAELTKMALDGHDVAPNSDCYDNDCGSPFMDLDSWQSKWIRPAWDRGVVQGYSNDRFMPNRAISRAEAVKIVLATYDENPGYTNKSFFNDVSGWSTGWIERAHDIGIVQGIGNGNFDPDRPITRAEAAKIIAKMIEHWDTKIR